MSNQTLYKRATENKTTKYTIADVEKVWNALWEIVHDNYHRHAQTDVFTFAQFGFDSYGKPNARLSARFTQAHGISQELAVHLEPHASRVPTLVAIQHLTRDDVQFIITDTFTALGSMCRENNSFKVELGMIGFFCFDGSRRHYTFQLNEVSHVHPMYRAQCERLCEINNKKEEFALKDPNRSTINITNKSGVQIDRAEKPTFDLTRSVTYKGQKPE